MIISIGYILNTMLSYFYIDVPILTFICGVSFIDILWMYLCSIVFRYCAYHRMFIHYIAINWLLDFIDYYIGVPINDEGMFLLYLVITGISLFLVLYLKFRKCNS